MSSPTLRPIQGASYQPPVVVVEHAPGTLSACGMPARMTNIFEPDHPRCSCLPPDCAGQNGLLPGPQAKTSLVDTLTMHSVPTVPGNPFLSVLLPSKARPRGEDGDVASHA